MGGLSTEHHKDCDRSFHETLHKNVDAATKASGVTTSIPITTVGMMIYPETYTDIEDLPGIGKEAVRKLRKAGIRLTNDLLYADLADLAEKTRLDLQKFVEWRAIAELNVVKGIGPYYAWVLVGSGVTSIDTLIKAHAKTTAAKMNNIMEASGKNIARVKVTASMIADWKTHGKSILEKKKTG